MERRAQLRAELAALDERLEAAHAPLAGPREADRVLTAPGALAWAQLLRMTLGGAASAIVASTVVWLGLGCADFGAALAPPEVEELLVTGAVRVEMTRTDQGGFPDRIVDYRIAAHGPFGERTVLEGRAQRQHVAYGARAAELPSGLVAIGLHDELCLLDAAGTVTCLDVSSLGDGARAMGSVSEALLWRANDPEADVPSRAHARAALESATRR